MKPEAGAPATPSVLDQHVTKNSSASTQAFGSHFTAMLETRIMPVVAPPQRHGVMIMYDNAVTSLRRPINKEYAQTLSAAMADLTRDEIKVTLGDKEVREIMRAMVFDKPNTRHTEAPRHSTPAPHHTDTPRHTNTPRHTDAPRQPETPRQTETPRSTENAHRTETPQTPARTPGDVTAGKSFSPAATYHAETGTRVYGFSVDLAATAHAVIELVAALYGHLPNKAVEQNSFVQAAYIQAARAEQNGAATTTVFLPLATHVEQSAALLQPLGTELNASFYHGDGAQPLPRQELNFEGGVGFRSQAPAQAAPEEAGFPAQAALLPAQASAALQRTYSVYTDTRDQLHIVFNTGVESGFSHDGAQFFAEPTFVAKTAAGLDRAAGTYFGGPTDLREATLQRAVYLGQIVGGRSTEQAFTALQKVGAQVRFDPQQLGAYANATIQAHAPGSAALTPAMPLAPAMPLMGQGAAPIEARKRPPKRSVGYRRVERVEYDEPGRGQGDDGAETRDFDEEVTEV